MPSNHFECCPCVNPMDSVPEALSNIVKYDKKQDVEIAKKVNEDALSKVAKSGLYDDLIDKPVALPNPQPITINGQRYDGSEAVTMTTVEIDDTMTQSGKAADAKAVGDRLTALNEAIVKDYVTPQMFGAKGDGKTDDSNAIQEAVNNGTNVFIPSGTYLINNTINIEKNVTIVGVKDRTVLKTVDKTIFNIVSGEVNFENIRFESNTVTYKQATNTDGVFPFDYYQFTYTNETSVAVYSEYSSPCKFFNCKFIKLYKGASTFNNSEFHDCRFSHCIVAYECRGFDPFFWNCYFTACKQGIIMSNTSYNTMFVYGCWFDQIGEHAIGTKDTGVGGYINGQFDQIGGSAICAKTLNRLNIMGRFSRCGAKYSKATTNDKTFVNGEFSSVIHAEESANMVYVNGDFVDSTIKGDSNRVDPVIFSVRTISDMSLSGTMVASKIYNGINASNKGTVVNQNGFYKIQGTSLVEIGTSN